MPAFFRYQHISLPFESLIYANLTVLINREQRFCVVRRAFNRFDATLCIELRRHHRNLTPFIDAQWFCLIALTDDIVALNCRFCYLAWRLPNARCVGKSLRMTPPRTFVGHRPSGELWQHSLARKPYNLPNPGAAQFPVYHLLPTSKIHSLVEIVQTV